MVFCFLLIIQPHLTNTIISKSREGDYMAHDQVYVRMKKKLNLSTLQTLQLKDIAYLSTTSPLKRELENMNIYKVTESDHNYIVIDSFIIIRHLNDRFPELEFNIIGPSEVIIHVEKKKRKKSILLVSFVWLILFIGTAMTIMNFHYDVSMQEVQQKLHYLLTGEQNEFPLWIQIPYSFGLGAGMLLFFNHWFKKRFNEEPSPLEIELYKYQQDIHQYISDTENDLNDQNIHH